MTNWPKDVMSWPHLLGDGKTFCFKKLRTSIRLNSASNNHSRSLSQVLTRQTLFSILAAFLIAICCGPIGSQLINATVNRKSSVAFWPL